MKPRGTNPVASTARSVQIPDGLRLARYASAPQYGPRTLFFSGGTALNSFSRALTALTHNSVHLITAFDSGGSSSKLRAAFGMLAIGDLRSRLMALADRSVVGHAAVVQLFTHRLPRRVEQADLVERLQRMVQGVDPLVAAVPEPLRSLVSTHLGFFARAMPPSFDLAGASVGNLVLCGALLNHREDIDAVVFMFSQLVEARGTVRPIHTANLHLQTVLEDDSVVDGQHRITGKEEPPIEWPIRELRLVDALSDGRVVDVEVRPAVSDLIATADLICYPMGSFYTSLIANFLPRGVGSAVQANHCPKVYVPSTGIDPEQLGMSVPRCVHTLARYLRRSAGDLGIPLHELITHVVVDSRARAYTVPLDLPQLARMGVQIIDVPLLQPGGTRIDDERLLHVLMSLT